MALWKSEVINPTTGVEYDAGSAELSALKPSWLLGGTDGVNGSNELATVTVSSGVGWVMRHDKGNGRYWDEILATCDTNGIPTAGSIVDKIVASDSVTEITLSAVDPNGDSLTYALTSGGGVLEDNVYTFTAGAVDALAETTTIRVSDDRGAFIDIDFDIAVNAPPTITPAAADYTLADGSVVIALTASAGTVGSPITYSVTASTEEDPNPVITQADPTTPAEVTLVEFDADNMTVTITDGTLVAQETIVISVTVTDAELLSAQADVTITAID